MRKLLIPFLLIIMMTIGLAACGGGGSGSIDGKWQDVTYVTEFKKGDIFIDEMGDEVVGTYKKLSGDKYEINMLGVELEYEITIDGDELTMKELDSGHEDVLTRIE